jgi:hypothetical protein
VANSITTTGTDGGPVSTEYEAGQSIKDWVSRHVENVLYASAVGAKLQTDWYAEDGKHTVQTDRLSGEGDEAFTARHEIEMLIEMLESNPEP